MGQAQINVRTRACSRTSIARTKQAALTHNVRGKELIGSRTSHAANTYEDYWCTLHMSTAVYSQLLIYTAEWTGASWRERKCPSFETLTKGDSDPGSLDCESSILPLSPSLTSQSPLEASQTKANDCDSGWKLMGSLMSHEYGSIRPGSHD